jgi:cell division protein FtsZ
MKFDLPQRKAASIKVIGVGGGGGNAVNHMYAQGIKDVDFIVCNTDVQDLRKSPVPIKIQLCDELTHGKDKELILRLAKKQQKKVLQKFKPFWKMIRKGLYYCRYGGGTRTGAAPINCRNCKRNGNSYGGYCYHSF